MQSSDKKLIQPLTSLRFFAAFAVVMYHFWPKSVPLFKAFHIYTTQGNKAVSFFYVLSGFVMALWASKNPTYSTLSYYKARVARIYPIYVFAGCASLLVAIRTGTSQFNSIGSVAIYMFGVFSV